MYLSVIVYSLGMVSHSLQEWPVTGGKILGEATEEGEDPCLELLLTGHEDGTVRFWDASGIALQPLYKFGSAQLFSGDEIASEGSNGVNDEDEDEWPPFRKVCFYFCHGIAYTSVLSDFRVECVVRSSLTRCPSYKDRYKYSETCLNGTRSFWFFFRFTKGCVLIKQSTKNMIA
jgi:hypothetical protein